MRQATAMVFCAGIFCIVLSSCAQLSVDDQEMPTSSDGAAFFVQNCSSCHGQDARGSGAVAGALAAAPSDLTTLSAENGGVFPASRALSYIYGDPENSHLTRVMPQFGGEMAEDLVPVEIDGVLTPTPRELAGLLSFMESIQQK